MRSEKYVYNPQTLQFEKVKLTSASYLWRISGFLAAVVVTTFLIYFFTSEFFPSPREKALKRELSQVEYQMLMLKDQLGVMDKVLGNLQQRDAQVHRVLFGMDPIDKDLWESGVGGHDPNALSQNFNITGITFREIKTRAGKLERQLYLQSNSLDAIEKQVLEHEEYLQSVPSIKPVRVDKLNRAVNQMSGFGIRLHPIHKISKFHEGIDFAAPSGTEVQATGNGRVVKVDFATTGYGRNILIDHGHDGYQTLYAHLKEIKVRKGDRVVKGQLIGTIGSTGTSTAPHLHYEVRKHGKAVNPIHFCMDGLTPDEYQEMVEIASALNQSFD
ncbi:MAG: M23 family metallopeptidase [Saprospiraceae bacterium]|nr:M23 family metallopeptidase [Saprospiraceae bacterium]